MKLSMLKPSQFNVTISDYPQPGQHLIFNTLSSGIVEIDNEGLAFLSGLENGHDLQSVVQDERILTFAQTLHERGFLVPREWKEGELFLRSLRSASQYKGGKLEVTLLTNLQQCPLGCKYCFQKGTHVGGQLAADLSDKAVEFVTNQCLKLEVERLWVCYYGSEPLSNTKAIFDTAAELQQFCKRHQIRFRFGMVTSGYLLTRELVEKLVPLGFVNAQITIDGDKETHDATRPLQSGKGTYDRITANLFDYAGLIRTDVLSVVNEDRVPAAYRLIDILAAEGLAIQKVRMRFTPESPDYLAETIKANNMRFADEGTKLMAAEKELLLEIARLSIYAHEKGLFDELLPQRTWCAMQRHDERHIVIEPDGTIRTCPNLIGRGGYEAGHISEGVGGIDAVIKEAYHRSQQCLECRFLPICSDCRVDTLQKKGDILAPSTHEEEYELIVPELVKAHYTTTKRQTSGTIPPNERR